MLQHYIPTSDISPAVLHDGTSTWSPLVIFVNNLYIFSVSVSSFIWFYFDIQLSLMWDLRKVTFLRWFAKLFASAFVLGSRLFGERGQADMRNKKAMRQTVLDSSNKTLWSAGAFGNLRMMSPLSSAGTAWPLVAAPGIHALVYKGVNPRDARCVSAGKSLSGRFLYI